MKKLISTATLALTACLALQPLSAFAITYYNWHSGADGYNHCYASDANGNVNAGETAVDDNICPAGNFAVYNWHQGADSQTHCYASDINGNVNAGEPSVDDSICE